TITDKNNIKETFTIRTFDNEPVIRVGLESGNMNIDFRMNGTYDIIDENDNVLMENVKSKLKWRVKILESTGATFSYSILLKEFFSEDDCMNELLELRKKGYDVRKKEVGCILYINGSRINNNLRYQLICGKWEDKDFAEKEMKKFKEKYECRIIKEKISESEGKLELFDSEYDRSAEIMNTLKLIPKSEDSSVTIYDVYCKKGNHNGRKEKRKLKGIVEIKVDNKGELTVISTISLEDYIIGLVSCMMSPDFPLESLKAQAIATRSKIISTYGLKHLNDNYDFCSSEHCELYKGIYSLNDNVRIAVKETKGKVLMHNGNACHAVYNPVCGGHTEDYYNIWNSPERPYLKGIFDSENSDGSEIVGPLDTEKKVERWINSRPKVNCNLSGRNFNHSLDFAKKYFRWEITYSRRELEEIIKRKTNEDIGILYDIIPRKRGISGRLKEIEILGSHKNIVLRNENYIRHALSDGLLNSSCFIVEVETGDDGTPINFTFIGAGSGHGVGMCQAGAIVMAEYGKSYEKILNHFYRGIKTEIIY
ncbi:hypothetical protein DRQ09_10195, partial [candidate division KSB1 bacterium]